MIPENLIPVARAIWEGLAPLMGDYSEVPFDHIMRRPRYAGVRQILARTMFDAITAAAAAGPPVRTGTACDCPPERWPTCTANNCPHAVAPRAH